MKKNMLHIIIHNEKFLFLSARADASFEASQKFEVNHVRFTLESGKRDREDINDVTNCY